MEKVNEQQLGAASEPAGLQRDWWQWLILAALIVLLYYEILARLVRQWIHDPNFSHGFFVPAFSAFVVWNERKRLAQLGERPSWWGAVSIALALSVLVLGVLGAELFLSRCSLVLLLGGLLIQFRGWVWFRALFFPWVFLFLMIPIPVIIFNQIAFPLQLLASKLASSSLSTLGVPVLREGNVLHLPVMSLEVVEACSGIRSLMSLCTLAVIYGYFLESGFWRRVLLALGAIPIAVAANALRIVGTGLLGEYWNPDKALGFFHTFSGWLIFVMSLALLFALHGLLRTGERWLITRRERAAR